MKEYKKLITITKMFLLRSKTIQKCHSEKTSKRTSLKMNLMMFQKELTNEIVCL